jgi:hypothetical protein
MELESQADIADWCPKSVTALYCSPTSQFRAVVSCRFSILLEEGFLAFGRSSKMIRLVSQVAI